VVIIAAIVITVVVWIGIRWSADKTQTENSYRSTPLHSESNSVDARVNLPIADATPSVPTNPAAASPGSRQQIGQRVNEAVRGDAQAQNDLMVIAQNVQAKSEEREIAIRYLGKSERPAFLTIVAKQLLSSNPRIRTAAFYSLPTKIRPQGYDYTSEPTEASIDLINKLVNQIKK